MSMVETDMIRGDIAAVMSQAEYNGGGIDSLKNNALLNAGSVVKSVQRGYVEFSSEDNRTISISTINPDKSILVYTIFVNGSVITGMGTQTQPAVMNYNLSTNEIKIIKTRSFASAGYTYVSWQVIEFY